MLTGTCRNVSKVIVSAACLTGSAAGLAAERYACIIIDDLGDNYQRSAEVAQLPAPISIAILPNTPYATTTAKLARKHGKDVLLHIPMQSVRHHKITADALTLHMTRQQFIAQLKSSLSSVPHLIGVNNHMGSLLTQHPGHMKWLMSTLAEYQTLFFVDSRTTKKSVAPQIADEHSIPSVQRDVFLDPDFDSETIERQFERFIRIIKQNGSALAIAHPHPNTLQLIKKKLDTFKQNNIKLVSISEYVNKRSKQHVTCTGTACTGL